MNRFVISAYAASNVGKKRQNNEDNYFLEGNYVNSLNSASCGAAGKTELLVSVCDGMGGEEAGEVASQIAVETVAIKYNQLINNSFSDSAIESFVTEANKRICDEISVRKKRLGTTLTLLGFKDGLVTMSNIGDSRIYCFSGNMLEQISKDHTQAQSMVDAGVITEEESMKVPEKHKLTQHLGIYPYEMIIEPYTVRRTAKAGDRYLLCSDGLTDMLTNDEIAGILGKHISLKETAEELILLALNHGGKDNVTVAVCEIGVSEETVVERPIANGTVSQPVEKKKNVLLKGVILIVAVAVLSASAVAVVHFLKKNKSVDKTDTTITETVSKTESGTTIKEEESKESTTKETETVTKDQTSTQNTTESTDAEFTKKSRETAKGKTKKVFEQYKG
ncbi:MAG: protein phosphatase 2C domain-containing protein [Clostridiales bacterium]|nr:protein phosphatase 2C domain-containing protein [Clostridiales bacterium]